MGLPKVDTVLDWPKRPVGRPNTYAPCDDRDKLLAVQWANRVRYPCQLCYVNECSTLDKFIHHLATEHKLMNLKEYEIENGPVEVTRPIETCKMCDNEVDMCNRKWGEHFETQVCKKRRKRFVASDIQVNLSYYFATFILPELSEDDIKELEDRRHDDKGNRRARQLYQLKITPEVNEWANQCQYSCHIGCNYTTNIKEQFKNHMKTTHGYKAGSHTVFDHPKSTTTSHKCKICLELVDQDYQDMKNHLTSKHQNMKLPFYYLYYVKGEKVKAICDLDLTDSTQRPQPLTEEQEQCEWWSQQCIYVCKMCNKFVSAEGDRDAFYDHLNASHKVSSRGATGKAAPRGIRGASDNDARAENCTVGQYLTEYGAMEAKVLEYFNCTMCDKLFPMNKNDVKEHLGQHNIDITHYFMTKVMNKIDDWSEYRNIGEEAQNWASGCQGSNIICRLCQRPIAWDNMIQHLAKMHATTLIAYYKNLVKPDLNLQEEAEDLSDEVEDWATACIYYCRLCGFKKKSRSEFISHILSLHKLTPEGYTSNLGPLEEVRNILQCQICYADILWDKSVLQQHLTITHRMTVTEYHSKYSVYHQKPVVHKSTERNDPLAQLAVVRLLRLKDLDESHQIMPEKKKVKLEFACDDENGPSLSRPRVRNRCRAPVNYCDSEQRLLKKGTAYLQEHAALHGLKDLVGVDDVSVTKSISQHYVNIHNTTLTPLGQTTEKKPPLVRSQGRWKESSQVKLPVKQEQKTKQKLKHHIGWSIPLVNSGVVQITSENIRSNSGDTLDQTGNKSSSLIPLSKLIALQQATTQQHLNKQMYFEKLANAGLVKITTTNNENTNPPLNSLEQGIPGIVTEKRLPLILKKGLSQEASKGGNENTDKRNEKDPLENNMTPLADELIEGIDNQMPTVGLELAPDVTNEGISKTDWTADLEGSLSSDDELLNELIQAGNDPTQQVSSARPEPKSDKVQHCSATTNSVNSEDELFQKGKLFLQNHALMHGIEECNQLGEETLVKLISKHYSDCHAKRLVPRHSKPHHPSVKIVWPSFS